MQRTRRREFVRALAGAVMVGCFLPGTARLRAGEKHETANAAREFAPGERVPASGIYDVVHDKLDGDDHAQPHRARFVAGEVFPPCQGCGQWVRFRAYPAAQRAGAASYLVP